VAWADGGVGACGSVLLGSAGGMNSVGAGAGAFTWLGACAQAARANVMAARTAFFVTKFLTLSRRANLTPPRQGCRGTDATVLGAINLTGNFSLFPA